MQHILIPTDFTVPSLQAVHAALGMYEGGKIEITLFHLLTMPTDLSGLMFRSMRNKHYEMVSDEFIEACEILQNRHSSRIASISIRFGFGDTSAYLQNLLEGMKVDKIFVCENVELKRSSSRSVVMLPLLKRTNFPLEIMRIAKDGSYSHGIDAVSMMQGNEMKVPKKDKTYVTQN